MKLQEQLNANAIIGTKKRIQELSGIAPDILIENLKENLSFLEESKSNYFNVTGDKEVLKWEVKSFESFNGRGGKSYIVFHCKEGDVNFFPNARYGRYIKIKK